MFDSDLESLNLRRNRERRSTVESTTIPQQISNMKNPVVLPPSTNIPETSANRGPFDNSYAQGNDYYAQYPVVKSESPFTYHTSSPAALVSQPPSHEQIVYKSSQSFNIPSQKPAPEAPPLPYSKYAAFSQLALIKTIIQFKDSKNISKLDPKLITSKVDSLLFKLGSFDDYKNILLSVKDNLKCGKCSLTAPDVFFSCGHQFCRTCFYNSIGSRIVPPSSTDPPLDCLTCGSPLLQAEYSYVFPDWEERMKLWESQERLKCSDEIKCKGCERRLSLSCFNGCKCFCFECVFQRRLFERCSCGMRNNYYISCDVCRKKIENAYNLPFFILCQGHLHCFDCFQQTTSDLTCKVCRFSLNEYDIRKSLKSCIYTCEYCKKRYFSKYFISKECCGFNICIACQSKQDNFGCVNCHNRFPFTVAEYMNNFGLIRY
jgi:hypothetical protein